MALMPVLADKSAWSQTHLEDASDEIQSLADADLLATCAVVALELLYSTRGPRDHDQQLADLGQLRWLPADEPVLRRALDVQSALVRRGQHRRLIPDLIVAATAEAHGAEVLHYDQDFELIAEITGQPVRWIVPRGAGH